MTTNKIFIDFAQLEQDRQKHLEAALMGLKDDGRGNLSVSMPRSEIADFKYACILRGKHYRQVVRENCKKFVEETPEVALKNAEGKAEFYNRLVVTLHERIEKEGSLIESCIKRFVNEGVMGIEKIKPRGRYSEIRDNTNPVGSKEIANIWGLIPAELRNPDNPEDVRRCMGILEERVSRIKNPTVRGSAIDQLERYKHDKLAQVFGELKEEDLTGKSIMEVMSHERAKLSMDSHGGAGGRRVS